MNRVAAAPMASCAGSCVGGEGCASNCARAILTGILKDAQNGDAMIQRVAIIGKGAVGLLYGGIAAEHLGADAVTFVMDDARYERHRSERVLINGRPCEIPTAPVSSLAGGSLAGEQSFDLVMLTIKATGLDQALDTMEALVGPRTRIISLLNGVRSEERIAERFGWQHTVLSVAQGMDAVFLAGELTYTHPGEVRLGAAEKTAPGVVADIADFLARAGIPHVVEDDIRHRMWTKLMLNVGINQTCMAFGGTYGSACAPGEQNRCFIAAMREAMAVARAEGVNLTERDLNEMYELTASIDPAGMPSMAQDRINHRLTEVDEFAGTIIRLAERHKILVPQNRWLYSRIREIESSW